MLIPKSGWKLLEEKDNRYILLARKAQHPRTKMIIWDIAAVRTRGGTGEPVTWVKPARFLYLLVETAAVKIVREVSDEEAVAVLLRAAKEH